MIKKCPRCSRENHESSKSCAKCGQWLSEVELTPSVHKKPSDWALIRNIGAIFGTIFICVIVTSTIYQSPQMASARASGTATKSSLLATETARPAPTPTSYPLGTKENPIPLGETSRAGDWDIVVLETEMEADAIVASYNEFNTTPRPDQRWVLLRVGATYRGPSDSGLINETSLEMTGDLGEIYSHPFAEVLADPFGAEVFQGVSTEGEVVFLVGKTESGLMLIYEPPTLFSERHYFAIE